MRIKFIKEYQVKTSKSVTDILNEISVRAREQKASKVAFLFDVIDYKRFKINDKRIQIDTFSKFYRVRGSGTITFVLSDYNEYTIIDCTIDPDAFIRIALTGIFVFISLIIAVGYLINLNRISVKEILFISGFFIFTLIIGYLSILFNGTQLEWYFKEILEDLNIIT
jgi:hypothetical protein